MKRVELNRELEAKANEWGFRTHWFGGDVNISNDETVSVYMKINQESDKSYCGVDTARFIYHLSVTVDVGIRRMDTFTVEELRKIQKDIDYAIAFKESIESTYKDIVNTHDARYIDGKWQVEEY